MPNKSRQQSHRGTTLRHDMATSHDYGQQFQNRVRSQQRDFINDENFRRYPDYRESDNDYQEDYDQEEFQRQSSPLQRSFAKPTPDSHLPWHGYDQYRGTHAGKGPKNYKRADERIREDVSEALKHHPGVDASEIEVSVKDGVVMLSGTVESRQMKRLAEESVEEISAVADVKNELRIEIL